jgi:hypothetical protein
VKRLLAALLLLAWPPSSAWAAGTAEIALVRDVANAAVEAASVPDRSHAIAAVHAVVGERFALEAIADFMAKPLGSPSAAQRARLRDVLHRYTSCALYRSLREVGELRVKPSVRTTRGAAAVVRSRVVAPASGAENAGDAIDWLLVDRADQPAVMDVRIHQRWTIGGRRPELEALYLQNGADFDAFLAELESKPATRPNCE